MNSKDFRQSYIDYFIKHNHTFVQSSSLVPQDDPTLLFTNAGMNQFKDYLLGKEERDYKRACNVQKCIRAGGKHNDLDAVGKDGRHATFFEMLGNWSFGDYYKKEAIEFAWEYMTKYLSLPDKDLYVSVYKDDDESYGIWKNNIGVSESKIVRLGNIAKQDEENFWSMGDTGPCGFCSEIYIDRGVEYSCGKLNCFVGCDCDRYMELWNLVFMEFDRDSTGKLSQLPKKNVDTGMGLDRVCALLQNTKSIFKTDLFMPIIKDISNITSKNYEDRDFSINMNVISDHIRCITFALSDGALFSNEGRGYVLRRILRRAIRHGKNLGLNEPFLFKLVDSVINIMGDAYPEIKEKRDYTSELIKIEEEKFLSTLDRGIEIINKEIKKIKDRNESKINGETAFLLYDTYGFPLDLTEIMAVELNLSVDKDGFNVEMEKQKKLARENMKFYTSVDENCEWITVNEGKSQFVGYESTVATSKILKYRKKDENIEIILDKTPFYAEKGGQIGDTGRLLFHSGDFSVINTRASDFGSIHVCSVVKGTLNDFLKSEISAEVESNRRKSIMRNHTSTHLLQRVLRMVLGEQLHQAGSYVDDSGFRFDFNYHKAIDPTAILQIEKMVNEKIMENIKVDIISDLPIDSAKKMGAMAIFGEKYGDKVRVVKVGDFSTELCGGTHVSATGEIGSFVIKKESSIASGTRRIEATSGLNVLFKLENDDLKLKELENLLTAGRSEIFQKVEKLIAQNKELTKKLADKRSDSAKDETEEWLKEAKLVENITIVIKRVSASDKNELLSKADLLRDKLKSGVGLLVAEIGDKAQVYIIVTRDIADKSILDASIIIKELFKICEGSGGGKAHLAQGGLKDKRDIEKFIQMGDEIIPRMILSNKSLK